MDGFAGTCALPAPDVAPDLPSLQDWFFGRRGFPDRICRGSAPMGMFLHRAPGHLIRRAIGWSREGQRRRCRTARRGGLWQDIAGRATLGSPVRFDRYDVHRLGCMLSQMASTLRRFDATQVQAAGVGEKRGALPVWINTMAFSATARRYACVNNRSRLPAKNLVDGGGIARPNGPDGAAFPRLLVLRRHAAVPTCRYHAPTFRPHRPQGPQVSLLPIGMGGVSALDVIGDRVSASWCRIAKPSRKSNKACVATAKWHPLKGEYQMRREPSTTPSSTNTARATGRKSESHRHAAPCR